jgi:hypothetical protein
MANHHGDSRSSASIADLSEAVRSLQVSCKNTEFRLAQVEETGKIFSVTQRKIDDKVDNIYKLLLQWNSGLS